MQPTDQNPSAAGGAFTGAQNYLPEKPTDQPQGRTSYPLPAGMGLKPGVLLVDQARVVRPAKFCVLIYQQGVYQQGGHVRPWSTELVQPVEINDPLGASQQAAREVIAQLLSMQAEAGVLGVLDFEPLGDDPKQSRLVLQIETPSELVSIAPPGLEDLQIGHDEQSTHYPRALPGGLYYVVQVLGRGVDHPEGFQEGKMAQGQAGSALEAMEDVSRELHGLGATLPSELEDVLFGRARLGD